jgi:hypothetical protein
MSIYLKAALILLVAVSAFNLGRYSVEFSGSTAAWVSLTLGVICLAVCVFALLFRDRKP